MTTTNTYDWNDTHEIGAPAPEMPDGDHDVTLTKIFWDKRDGTPMTSKTNLPQMGFVFANAAGEEAIYYCSVDNGPIHWPERSIVPVLRALSGITVAKMQAAKITPEHFLNREWAEKALIQTPRTAKINVRRRSGKPDANGTVKVYVDVTPIIPALPAPPPASKPRTQMPQRSQADADDAVAKGGLDAVDDRATAIAYAQSQLADRPDISPSSAVDDAAKTLADKSGKAVDAFDEKDWKHVAEEASIPF